VNLDEKHPPTLLHQLRRSRSSGHLHAAFGIDVHAGQAAGVEHFLDGHDRFRVVLKLNRFAESRFLILLERLAHDFEGVGDSFDGRFERLGLDVLDDWQGVGRQAHVRGN
jgi:hypothetical protein